MNFTAYTDFTVGEIEPSIPTVHPAKDWVISDYVVTDYGAQAVPGFDNRAAFQAAIDAAQKDGGGVVFAPAGNYEFRSMLRGTANQRVVNPDGSSSIRSPQYVLRLPPTVQLRGEWADPEKNNGRVLGTILEVRAGANSPSFSIDRFIEMDYGTGVSNLSIWHPEQDINNVAGYGWSLYQTGFAGCVISIENITLVNSYNGFYTEFNTHLAFFRNSYMTVLNTGIEVNVCTDILRLENLKLNPKYWAESGLPGAPSVAPIRNYTRANGTGYKQFRSDWSSLIHVEISGYKTAFLIGPNPTHGTSNALLYGVDFNDCETAMYVDQVDPSGLIITSSRISGDTAVFFTEEFYALAQFNDVAITGPIIVSPRRIGIAVVSFENCTFAPSSAPGALLQLNSSSRAVITQSRFTRQTGHVDMGEARLLKSLNSGFGAEPHTRTLAVTNERNSPNVEIVNDARYVIEPPPPLVSFHRESFPRPASNNVLKADFPREWQEDNALPMVDVSAAMQASLDALAAAGGGTLYLKGGRYLVNNPIVVPTGVELRGMWEGPHHTMGSGTALFTWYDGGRQGENGPSLIQLQPGSGIRGFKIVQANLVSESDGFTRALQAPFLVQGQGADVHIVNLTVPLGDRAIDLFSYKTDRHYVDYFAATVVRAGVWIGGGAEGGEIRNAHLNPHFSWWRPKGTQGYPDTGHDNPHTAIHTDPMVRLMMNNQTGFRIGDVKNQTLLNNFTMFSLYGVRFVKDELTGNFPGDLLLIAQGLDLSVFPFYVEDAGPDTRIRVVNMTVNCGPWANQPVAHDITMGASNSRADPNSQLTFYNSILFGIPTPGIVVNNGTVTFRQAHFMFGSQPNIDVTGGNVRVSTSFFPQARGGQGSDVHAQLRNNGRSLEFSNNLFAGRGPLVNAQPGAATGSDFN